MEVLSWLTGWPVTREALLVVALPFDQYRLLAGQVPEVLDLGAAYTGLRLVKSGRR